MKNLLLNKTLQATYGGDVIGGSVVPGMLGAFLFLRRLDMKEYQPSDEAGQICRTIHSLKALWDLINVASDYGELLTARRMCELVIADEIRNLNDTLEDIKSRFPDICDGDLDCVEVPDLAIN